MKLPKKIKFSATYLWYSSLHMIIDLLCESQNISLVKKMFYDQMCNFNEFPVKNCAQKIREGSKYFGPTQRSSDVYVGGQSGSSYRRIIYQKKKKLQLNSQKFYFIISTPLNNLHPIQHL